MFMPYSTTGKKMMTAMKSWSNRSTSGITLISLMPCRRPYRCDLVRDIAVLDGGDEFVGEIFQFHRLVPDARRDPVVAKQRRHRDEQPHDGRQQRRRNARRDRAEPHRA